MRKLLLIDGHSLIHRAYHAYPRTLATRTGELTNAIYGFTNILLSAIADLAPTHAAVAFDLPEATFREQMFVGYKQSRVKPDDDMIVQIPRIKEIVAALNIPIYEVAGFEADDVIGTLAEQAIPENSEDSDSRSVRKSENQKAGISGSPALRQSGFSGYRSFPSVPKDTQVVILTSDRDLMQLVRGDRVVVQLPARGKIPQRTVTESDFLNDWGFAPRLLPDFKALAGDQSDDIPGVKGIGEKTARELVVEYGGIDDIYRTPPRRGPTLIKKLAEGHQDAQLFKKLATIDTQVPIKLDWQQMEIHRYNKRKILELFEELQFKSLIRKLPNDSFEQIVQETFF
jgi:DNA polymerase-1